MRDKVLKRLKEIKDLPTLPEVVSRVIVLAQAADVSIRELSGLIHEDPPLAAKVLKVANAPYYRCFLKDIDSLDRAIILLGMEEIVNIVTSISVISVFTDNSRGIRFKRRQFWNHCVATGIIARSFARELRVKTAGKEFVGGLLHDIGKILLDAYFHEPFMDAYEYSLENRCPLFMAESRILGITHMEIGYLLALKWDLPQYLGDIILNHHWPDRARFKDMAAIVSIANLLTKAGNYAYGGEKSSFILSDQNGWKVLSNMGYSLDRLDVERFTLSMDNVGEEVDSYISTASGDAEGR